MNRRIRKHLVRGLLLGALILAIGSCSVIVTIPSYIRISNTSIYTITSVYITPANAAWGNDQLAPSQIAPGQSARWSLNPGTYDVKAYDNSGLAAVPETDGVVVSSSTTVTLYYDGTNPLAP
jgi:hypothetical protein